MPRFPRVHIPNAFYHAMLRGNAGNPIFFNDGDYRYFYHLLEQSTEKYGYEIHAFCCMTNHVHLLVRVQDIPLSKIMHNIAFKYASWINYKRERNGHLFQGRFKSIWVDHDSYLLQLTRYIHRNPLEAGMVNNLDDYPWSSHLAYIGQQSIPWLTTNEVLEQLSAQPEKALKRYHDFLLDSKTSKGETEQQQLLMRIEQLLCAKHLIDSRKFKQGMRTSDIVQARQEFIFLAIHLKLATQKQLASYLKLSESSVSRGYRRAEKDLLQSKILSDLIQQVTID